MSGNPIFTPDFCKASLDAIRFIRVAIKVALHFYAAVKGYTQLPYTWQSMIMEATMNDDGYQAEFYC